MTYVCHSCSPNGPEDNDDAAGGEESEAVVANGEEGDINMVIRTVDPAGEGVVSIPALKELLQRDAAHAGG